jgi:hypothetical protein
METKKLLGFMVAILAVLITNSLFAQNIGSWSVLDVKKNGSKGTSYQLEGQVRSLKFYDNFHYNELNFTANFKYNDNLTMSVLLGKHNTYSEGGSFKSPVVTDEYRLSLQAATTQKFGRFFLDNRYRIEQRYFCKRLNVDRDVFFIFIGKNFFKHLFKFKRGKDIRDLCHFIEGSS